MCVNIFYIYVCVYIYSGNACMYLKKLNKTTPRLSRQISAMYRISLWLFGIIVIVFMQFRITVRKIKENVKSCYTEQG